MNNIWVLDDDKSIRWVFEKALGKENLPFKTFSNTNEAINQFNHEFFRYTVRVEFRQVLDNIDADKFRTGGQTVD